MLYTVKEVSELSKVTVKTLHHYHKIGLLAAFEDQRGGVPSLRGEGAGTAAADLVLQGAGHSAREH
ncbi:MerR family DNA-binding transcriptional regulator [Paenibacillus sp. P26]|nr:MerR family DNA-binding transcriptional regulator [Paenibacillus sp. P26]